MEENNHFLDKNTLVAIGLSIAFFIGWQIYIQKKYPKQDEKHNTAQKKVLSQQKSVETSKSPQNQKLDKTIKPLKKQQTLPEQRIWKISMDNLDFQMSSRGMGLVHIELNGYSDRNAKKIEFNANDSYGNFATLFENEVVDFSIKRVSEEVFEGIAFKKGYQIRKKMSFQQENYAVAVELEIVSPQDSALEALVHTDLSDKALQMKSSFLTPSYEGTEFFIINSGSEQRQRVDPEADWRESYKQSTFISIGSLYFGVALMDKTDFIPEASARFDSQQQKASIALIHRVKSKGAKTQIHYQGFMGPKKYDILKKLDPAFVGMINYGMFGLLSKPMLNLLKYLYGVFSNWGVAIILLTIVIRLLLLPVNLSSLRSMKKMQKIQPQMKALKEKYKDDPQRMNQETMALMKREKANPIGGCLPMILQIPVFLALYSVLGQSIELYKSPFIFWIQDLSYRDPFFVLPISVGVLYFLQMSISPQPVDPTQAKVMKMMPILFCVFMIAVPSGLTLYFLVNTVFGIGQQFIFQKQKAVA